MKATLLQFPQRNKGRVRKSGSLQAMGEYSLRACEREPANVERLDDRREVDTDQGQLALLLAATVFSALPKTKKATLRRTLDEISQLDPRAREILHIIGKGK